MAINSTQKAQVIIGALKGSGVNLTASQTSKLTGSIATLYAKGKSDDYIAAYVLKKLYVKAQLNKLIKAHDPRVGIVDTDGNGKFSVAEKKAFYAHLASDLVTEIHKYAPTTLTQDKTSITEGVDSITFTVTGTPGVTLNWAVDANHVADVNTASGTVTLNAAGTATFTVAAKADGLTEGNEQINVALTNNAGVVLGSSASTTIVDTTVPPDDGFPAENLFTLTEVIAEPGTPAIPDSTAIYWGYNLVEGSGGIPVADLVSFLTTITGLDLKELGLIDADGQDPFQNVTSLTLSNPLSPNNSNSGGASQGGEIDQSTNLRITFADGTFLNAEVALGDKYFEFLNNLLFDAEGNSRLFEKTVDGTPGTGPLLAPIVLTPTQNNGGTIETGVTNADNDLIVAGRLELLHQAYIDGGAGYNILEVDAKGTYAQPLALKNIQEVRVNDLPNFYTTHYGDPTADGNLDNTQFTDTTLDFPNPIGDGSDNSWLDLSRAINIQKLVVTDSGYGEFDFGDLSEDDGYSGDLSIVGVRNAATLRLEGAFISGSTTIQYGQGQNGTLNVELALGDVTEDINILQNASVLNIDSQGVENHMHSFFAGGSISRMYIKGTGVFAADEDLSSSFNAGRPAIIDASANTGGLDVTLTGHYNVTVLGTIANDEIVIGDVTDGGVGKVKVDAKGGNNLINVYDSELVSITTGDGDDEIFANSNDEVIIVAGNGNNVINTDDSDTVDITTTGIGNDTISSVRGDVVTIAAGDGTNDITVSANEINITTGAGNDTLTLSGFDTQFDLGDSDSFNFGAGGFNDGNTDNYGVNDHFVDNFAPGALLNLDLGAGVNTINLGRDVTDFGPFTLQFGLTALEGSVIKGTGIKLFVENNSDLTEADLTGATISSVVLKQELRITADQFHQIGSSAFSVKFDEEGATEDLYIVVNENTTLSSLVNLAQLNTSVRLHFEIHNGATLTLSAAELHKYVAEDGIISDDGLNGKVIITDAGFLFNAFDNGDDYQVIDGGTLSDTYFDSDDVTIIRTPGGYNRPTPDDSTDTTVIDTTGTSTLVINDPIVIDGGNPTTVKIIGNQDVQFNAPIDLGDGLDHGDRIDFSELDGDVIGLTVKNFDNILSVAGNNTDTRINVELSGDVGTAEQGLVSSGVETYVVTSIVDGDNNDGDFNTDTATFWLCDQTQDVDVIGLQGNAGKTLTFGNVPWGLVHPSILLEGDGYADWNQGLKADGNPNASDIGNIEVNYFTDGAPAIVNINNGGVELGVTSTGGERFFDVGTITLGNATSLVLNITEGDAVIAGIQNTSDSASQFSGDYTGDLDTLEINASEDVTIEGELPSDLGSIDASGVVGVFTAEIDLWQAGENGPLEFIGAAGGTELTIDDAAEGAIGSISGAGPVNLTIGDDAGTDSVDLTETALGNIGTVSLHENTELSVTLEQADVIGPESFQFLGDEGQQATLNLVGLNDQVFSIAQYPDAFAITLTLAELPEVHINPLTDFTGIDSLIIPEGTTLYLSMAQFQQLGVQGMGPDDVVLTGEGSVVITDTTQASVGENGEDLDLTSIALTGQDVDGNDISTVTVNLVEDVNLSEATMALADLSAGGALPGPDPDPAGNTGPSVDVFNIGGFTLTLGDINTADTTQVIGGAGSTLKFTDTDEVILSRIDAGGFDVDFLEVEAALVADNNVDFMFDNLIERVTKVIVDEFGQVIGRIQNVEIEATTTVPGDLSFNDYGLNSEVTTLNVNLGGGVLLGGDLIVSTVTPDSNLIAQYLKELNIVSEGTAANTINGETDNVITGDITPIAPFPGYDPDGPGGQFGPAADNNLKLVNITATQNLVIGGDIIFSSHGSDGVFENEPNDGITANEDNDATVTLNISGTADVTVQQLDMSDEDIGSLVINNTGTGTLTVTGSSPAIVTGDDSESVIITGTGDVVLSDTLSGTTNTTVDSDSLSLFDASGHSGLLAAGEFGNVDNEDFSFIAGSGVTTLLFTDADLDSTNGTPTPTTADDTAGWTFNFSNADAGSEFHFAPGGESFIAGSKLSIDMGPDAVLYIDTSMDLSDLDLSIVSGHAIVLADGAELILSAEQADGLTIIGENGADSTGVVNIVNLNEEPVDLGGISEDVAGVATLQLDDPIASPEAADVTLNKLTDLGSFAIQLEALTDADDILSGQTIRFTTVEQADGREVQVVDEIGNNAPGIDTVNSTNVVWLFENLNGGDPIDTSGYFEPPVGIDPGYQIGRLWINDTLIGNEGGNIEDLFTTLPTAIIRAEFLNADLLDALLSSQPVDRIFEVVNSLDLGDISFNDTGLNPDEHIRSLTVKMGGQANIDSITLDDEIAPNTDPASVAFDTLRIESHRSLSDDYFLASEFYDNNNDGTITLGENVAPAALNTIGNIGTGNGLALENVSIDTLNDSVPLEGTGSVVGLNPGAALQTGTITFDSNDAGTIVNLTVDGENDVTIASVNTTDADIVGIATVNNLAAGATLIAPGASPAFNLDNTEGWELTGAGDMEAGSATNAGVVGNELSLIDASTSTGDLAFGVVAQIDSTDDVATDFNGDGDKTDVGIYEDANIAFEFIAGHGVNTMTLATANGRTPQLNAGQTWSFDYSNATGDSSLTITDDVIFQPTVDPLDPTTLVLEDVPVIIEGNVDLSKITLDFNPGTTVFVPEGNTLILTVDQVLTLAGIGVHIFGEGTTEIVGDGTDTDLVGGAFRSNIDTVNIDVSAVTLDTTLPLPDDADDKFVINVGSAVDDDGNSVGHNVKGSANDDVIDGGIEDDTLTGGAGDDSLIGNSGADTFIVDAGTDTIEDLTGDADPDPMSIDDDVLIVEAGATANAAVPDSFVATAETVNNGTANLSRGMATANGTIDVSSAGGSNGFNLSGSSSATLSNDTLIGSAQADVINGGNLHQTAAAAADVLTGNGGSDVFAFDLDLGTVANMVVATTTLGIDRERITLTADTTDGNNEAVLIGYSINGVLDSVNVDLTGVDVTVVSAVAGAIATALNGKPFITASTDATGVIVNPGSGNNLTINSLTWSNADGVGTGLDASSYGDNGDDVAQITTLTINGTPNPGDFYSLIADFASPGAGQSADYTALVGNGADQVAAGLEAAYADGTGVNADVATNVITFTDTNANDGGFVLTTDATAAFAGSGASDNGAVDYTTADVITDFLSGTDKIDFGLQAGSGANYLEVAGVADYTAAKGAADTAFFANAGTLQYYLTSATDLDGAGPETNGSGLLFFDANLDGNVDGVVLLTGVTSNSFAALDIQA